MSYALGIGLGVLALVLVAAIAREWSRYRRGTHFITRRQMIIRAICAAVLISALGMIAVGMSRRFADFDAVLTYWGIGLSLAALAMGLATWDLRILRSRSRRRRAESYGRMSVYIREIERRRGSEQAGGE
jgi:uncharacterized membrane protein YbhN (UPF0104 family)